MTVWGCNVGNNQSSYLLPVKYGTPNSRIEELFQHIPKLRDIGLYHHRMTFSMPYVPDSEQEDDVDS